MSRVILSRHDNGGEKVVVGYDPPLANFFAHEYDDEGECIRNAEGTDTDELAFAVGKAGITIEWTLRLRELLQSHVLLDYPQSNVQVDLTRPMYDRARYRHDDELQKGE